MKFLRKIAAACFAVVCCAFSFVGCEKKEGDLTVYAPDGAPALALAKLMAEDTKEDGVTYRVVAPSLIASKVTYKKSGKNADFCVLPLTAASKLLGSGEEYLLLGVVTHGNLYIVAKEGTPTITDFSGLEGKEMGVLQMNEVPGLTLQVTLNKWNIPYAVVKNDGETAAEKLNLRAISGADAVGVTAAEYFLLAEPAATAQTKKGYRIVGDLQALYGEGGYPQAVLVGKRSVVEKKSAWTAEFLRKIADGEAYLQTAGGEALVKTISAHREDEGYETSLKAPLLSQEVLSRCGIYFTSATDSRAEIEDFIFELKKVNEKAAATPSEKFYWSYEG